MSKYGGASAQGINIWINGQEFAEFYSLLSNGVKMASTPLRKAGNYIKKQSRQYLKQQMATSDKTTGKLYGSYAVRVYNIYKSGGNKGVMVGFTAEGHHAHLVDKGHKLVVGVRDKNGNYHSKKTGKFIKAKPFHTKVRENDMDHAAEVFAQEYIKYFNKRIAKMKWYAAKGGRNGNEFVNQLTPAQCLAEAQWMKQAISQIATMQSYI